MRGGARPPATPKPAGEGFTLLELLLALGIAAAVLVIAFGGLRVGLAAWTRGEERAARIDHARSVVVLLEQALGGAFPYRPGPVDSDQQEPHILFEGRPDRLTFATLSPPFPAAAPIAFTLVSLSSEPAGLTVRQQVLPDRIAVDRLAPVLVDRETSALRFRYLGEESTAWQEEWDMTREDGLPRAVEITLVTAAGTRRQAERRLTVAIRATTP